MCWTKLKSIGHTVVKKLCPSQKTLRPLGVSSCLWAYPAVSGPGTIYLLDTPLIVSEPVTQTLSCELNLIETLQLCLFLKHSHTVALICNVASHNINK